MPQILSSDLSSLPECNRLHQVIVRNTSKNIHPRSPAIIHEKGLASAPPCRWLFALGVPTYFAQKPIATTMPPGHYHRQCLRHAQRGLGHSGTQQIRDGTS